MSSQKPKVVVMDDIKEICLLYKHFLEPDFEVLTSFNYPQLKNLVSNNDIQYIIMDYSIPGVSFSTVLEFLNEKCPKVGKVLVSGHTESLNLKEKFKDDFDVVLSKPIEDLFSLKKIVHEHLK